MERLWKISAIALLWMAGCQTRPDDPCFAITPSQGHADIVRMRRHIVKLQRPLLVIGGYHDPGFATAYLEDFFHQIIDGQKLIVVNLDGAPTMDACRQRVIDAVDKAIPNADPQWTTEVDVVGYSLGGLAARYAAAPSMHVGQPRRLRIARLFSISAPQAGARAARHATPHSLLINSLTIDLVPGSPLLQWLAKADEYAQYKLVCYVLLDDETVGDRLAAPPGKQVYWLPNVTPLNWPHESALYDQRILADISRRLRGEEPFTRCPPPPIP